MGKDRIVSRRSFLTQVAGTALIAAAAMAPAQAGRRRRRMAVDADPSDPARPLTTRPRPRISAPPPPPNRGPSDADTGPTSDAQFMGGGPPSRFVICPGNRRCPGRNR